MVFQFEHVSIGDGDYGKWTTDRYDFMEFKQIMNDWQEKLDENTWNSLFLDNHDQPRCVSRFGNDSDEYCDISAKMLATCLHMMKGTPYVYQGEELGMRNAYFDDLSKYKDIESLQFYDLYTSNGCIDPETMMKALQLRGRDNARTPMHWNAEENAGFTEGTPWIDMNTDYKTVNAEAQVGNEDSVFSYYKKLIQLRKDNEIVVYGDYKAIDRENEKIFAYERVLGDEKILTVCNFTEDLTEFQIPEDFDLTKAECWISNTGRTEFDSTVELKPYEAFVLKI